MKHLVCLILTTFCITASADLVKKKADVVTSYAKLVHRNYSDALVAAQAMKSQIATFVANPSAEGLILAKRSWIDARIPYLQTEVFRFYNGPIDDEDGPEGLLNAWPMDESYLDGVVGAEESGLIQNPEAFPKITRDLLISLNEKDGEKNISSGYHAIEFLLWGQDFSTDSAGQRPYTDFTSTSHAERRKQVLTLLCDLLVEHLQHLVDEWAPNEKDNYRTKFTSAPVNESLQKILTGMSMLSGFEMASERLAVAYDTQEQEDEHSCFSDTTHIDINQDLIGIRNVWFGDYGNYKGTGLNELAAKIDPELGQQLSEAITHSILSGVSIPTPFDQAILGNDNTPSRKAILKTIEALENQASLLVKFSKKLGFEVPISEE